VGGGADGVGVEDVRFEVEDSATTIDVSFLLASLLLLVLPPLEFFDIEGL
jgi:hypothetical protein